MFQKILIANRGEIACRIIRTARRMGVATVAVYSDADRDALHVAMADEALRIGPAPAAESYLSPERILAACRASGAEAVHPGYGFLSERADFCALLEGNGVVFIGPKAEAIRAMGDKIRSKQVAAAAGVSIVPGHPDAVEDAGAAVRIAAALGYPVMIKASAGGGGKGMRVAANEAECREGFARARSEALAAFGDDRVFIERFVEQPRHIEIQVLGDRHGSVIHLGERECSIQRRNQKVLEEAPSPFLDAGTRAAMGAEAVALARAVGYESAGTVEFIVDRDRRFYFLEMNTRLQVEHPVTELVTGIDLVEMMLRIAAGEPLGLTQDDVRLSGWAVESRIYAEDPARGFLPSTGRLTRYRPPPEGPAGSAVRRNDAGVREGSTIPVHYDPMIAKLCAHAAARGEAVDAMIAALDRFAIEGVAHNIPFLSALMRHPRWREGRLSTAFIAEEFPDGFRPLPPDDALLDRAALVAVSIEIARRRRLEGHADRLRPGPARLPDALEVLVAGGASVTVGIVAVEETSAGRRLALRLGDRRVIVETLFRAGGRSWEGTVDGAPVFALVRDRGIDVEATLDGRVLLLRALEPAVAALQRRMPERLAPDTARLVLCPMPGAVLSVAVRPGQEVKVGDTLAVVEAMKMENVLRAERDGTVAEVRAAPGDTLAVDAVILTFA